MVKYFLPKNYYYKWKLFIKHLKYYKLTKMQLISSPFKYIWSVPNFLDGKIVFDNRYCMQSFIFGSKLELTNINWNCDAHSGFIFKLNKYNRYNIEDFYNKGIDVKYPWEISRCYFCINLAIQYLHSGDNKYYELFKNIIYSFILQNPFLNSINWVSPMDTSIRAINFIISINLFSSLLNNDSYFYNVLSKSLLQHGSFIKEFPEVYTNGLTTNHTLTNYASLLFIGLTFPHFDKSKKWIELSTKGLERCVYEQVYPDGIDFEGSIAYHRLVLEILAFTTIVARANGINFSDNFFFTLFMMFEFTAAYMDSNGNAPQVGDNDSGRYIIFNQNYNVNHYTNELDHSYLLSLGEHIFEYNFRCQCTKRDINLLKYLPHINKVHVDNYTTRNTNNSIAFEHGGAYFLKNNTFSLLVSCFPLGQKGQGGHNHLDIGSFTLSINGNQVIVDPGTQTYTRNKLIRDKYRSYTYHNTLYTDVDLNNRISENSYWGLKEYYNGNLIEFSESNIKLNINYIYDPEIRIRHFHIDDNFLTIEDMYTSEFFSRFNLHPHNSIVNNDDRTIVTTFFTMYLSNYLSYKIQDYEYSPHYDHSISSKCIIITANKYLMLRITTR